MKVKHPFFRKSRRASIALAIIAALLVFTGALAADEMLDPNFGTNGAVISSISGVGEKSIRVALQADGKIILSGLQGSTPFITRYNSNGTIDSSFGQNGSITPLIGTFSGSRVAIQSDEKLIVAGTSQGSFAVARYNSNGAGLDNTFGTNGVAVFPVNFGDVRYATSDLAIQRDHKIVVVGTQIIGNFTNYTIVRFNTDGTPDTTFVANGIRIMDKVDFPNNRFNNARAVAIQADGKIIMSGDMLDDDANGQITLARLTEDGSLDTTAFGTNGKGTVITPLENFQNGSGALALQSDGRIVVAGTIFNYAANTNEDVAVARFNSNGSLDTTFGGSGIVVTNLTHNENGFDLAIQPDGKIILAGKIYGANFYDILLLRYNSDGSLDTTFGDNGKLTRDFENAFDSANGIIIQPDGLLVVAGSSNDKALLARYITDVSGHQVFTATSKSASAHDGWVLESGENSSSGGSLNKTASTILVGDDVRDRQYRGFLSFNTAFIPDNAVVTSAHIDIRRQTFVGTSPFTTHGDLLLDIRAGTFSNALALQLVDFNAAATAGATQERFTPITSVWYTSQLNSANLGFINKYGYTQFRLRYTLDDNDDMSADHLKFFSGEALDEYRPKLIITYFVP